MTKWQQRLANKLDTMKHLLRKIFFWDVKNRKMKVVILSYIIGFLLWFGLLWFDSLLQLPFALLLLAGFIFSISFAVRAFKRKGKWRERLLALTPLALVALCGTLLFLPLTDWKVKVDHGFLSSQRLKAIENIPMDTQAQSEVKLPHWWLSEDGTAYVFNPNRDCLLVGFWVRRGMLSPSWIVVYSAQDSPPTAEELRVGEILFVKKLSPHWYYLGCS